MELKTCIILVILFLIIWRFYASNRLLLHALCKTINTDLHSLDNLRKHISELSNTSDAISELLQTQRKQKLYSVYGGYESTSISKSRNQPYQNSPKNVTMLR